MVDERDLDDVADIAVRHVLESAVVKIRIHSRKNLMTILSGAPIKLFTVRNVK